MADAGRNEPRSQLSDDRLAALVEANVAAFLLQMGAAGGGIERSDQEATWTVGGSPIGYHNAVVRCTAGTIERATELVSEFVAALRARQLPGSWHVTPTMRPPHLGEVLLTAGFQDGGEEPAMVASLPPSPAPVRDDLAIAAVADVDAMRDYRDVLASGFGEGPKEADWVAQVFSTIGDDAAWAHFVGRVDRTPVATASLLMTPPIGGIYFVCTTPHARRRGYGAAITHHAMAEAAARGASHAALGSSPMGQRIYERLGFRTLFSYQLLEWEPEESTVRSTGNDGVSGEPRGRH